MSFIGPTIILDFDGTLFSSEDFLRDLCVAAERRGIDRSLLLDTWGRSWSHQSRNSGYAVSRHAQHLAEHSRYSADELHEWLQTHHAQMGDYVYPDVHLFLCEMHDAGVGLVLLTHGDPSWQLRKMRATGLADHFDAIYATHHPKQVFLKDWLRREDTHHMLFVNDNPEENWTIAHAFPRLAQAMRRNESRWDARSYERVGFPHFSTLHDIGTYAEQFFSRI